MVKLKDEDFIELETIACNAAITGGFTAMRAFRSALEHGKFLEDTDNPATEADMHATLAIARNLYPAMHNFAGRKARGYKIFAEEFEKKNDKKREKERIKMLSDLGDAKPMVCNTTDDFADALDNCIVALYDAIDGTSNFKAGIPLFCSAVSLFVDKIPRVGAIFDPHNDVVYYGSKGIDKDKDKDRAFAWSIKLGLKREFKKIRSLSKKKPIGFHIARGNEQERINSLRILKKVSEKYHNIYVFNCGQLSLVNVALGSHAGFINNWTSTWDVSAGEVLLCAVGGKISRIDGNEIKYNGKSRIDVLAGHDAKIHSELCEIINEENNKKKTG